MQAPKGKREKDRGGTGPTGQDDLIWGINPVREALGHRAANISEILIQRGKAGPKYQEIIDLARSHRIRLRFVETDRMGLPAKSAHQGVVARVTVARLVSLEELLAKEGGVRSEGFPRILVLDSIQDPRNLGAIFRSALAAGFSSVVMTRERSAPISGTVAKASAGAVTRLTIAQAVNLSECLKKIKQNGFWIFGAVLDSAAVSIYDADFRLPLCLVVGGEEKGIRPLVQKQCDQLITIPMPGDFDSLNVSVAAAVIMFEAGRQQDQSA